MSKESQQLARSIIATQRRDYLSGSVSERRIYRRAYLTERSIYTADESGLISSATTPKTKKRKGAKRKLSLLLPGHNEELIIATTIRSAIAAGQNKKDIFVVDDCSSDNTSKEAIALLGKSQVLRVERSGKALAVKKAIKHFKIEKNYKWVHIADADSVFGKDYFRIYKKSLDDTKYVVALGFVQSLRGNWISKYRAFTYTYSQHVYRRFQSYLGMISVFPGPITCFSTRILKDLDFDGDSLTEDFDITLQVHRKKLGKIKFIPKAVNYTQDPQALDDFIKQNQRWQRGFFQGLIKYRIGTKLQPVDIGIMYQMVELFFYLLQMFVVLPYVLITQGNWEIVPVIFLLDFAMLAVIALFSAAMTKRWSMLLSLGYFYVLRMLELGVFCQAFIEVVVLKKFRSKSETKGWSVAGRRYQISQKALLDTA